MANADLWDDFDVGLIEGVNENQNEFQDWQDAILAAELGQGDSELLDPHPDVHTLFVLYNDLYFEGKLGACSVEWSTGRMTLCAGVCHYQNGGGCRIKLSEPLLKYRPTKDLKETLLHEMIHAYMFLEGIRDRDDHGPKFCAKMQEINTSGKMDPMRPTAGYHITTHHTMIDEVNLYRTHWWTCDRCGHVVKRAMNRPPQEADCRGRMGKGSACQDPRCNYHMHIKQCGGTFVKTKSPDDSKLKQQQQQQKRRARAQQAAAAAGAGDKRHKPGQQQQQQQQPQHEQQAAGSKHITDFFQKKGKPAPSASEGTGLGKAGNSKPAGGSISGAAAAGAAGASQAGTSVAAAGNGAGAPASGIAGGSRPAAGSNVPGGRAGSNASGPSGSRPTGVSAAAAGSIGAAGAAGAGAGAKSSSTASAPDGSGTAAGGAFKGAAGGFAAAPSAPAAGADAAGHGASSAAAAAAGGAGVKLEEGESGEAMRRRCMEAALRRLAGAGTAASDAAAAAAALSAAQAPTPAAAAPPSAPTSSAAVAAGVAPQQASGTTATAAGPRAGGDAVTFIGTRVALDLDGHHGHGRGQPSTSGVPRVQAQQQQPHRPGRPAEVIDLLDSD